MKAQLRLGPTAAGNATCIEAAEGGLMIDDSKSELLFSFFQLLVRSILTRQIYFPVSITQGFRNSELK